MISSAEKWGGGSAKKLRGYLTEMMGFGESSFPCWVVPSTGRNEVHPQAFETFVGFSTAALFPLRCRRGT
jgi:hypothetical protein